MHARASLRGGMHAKDCMAYLFLPYFLCPLRQRQVVGHFLGPLLSLDVHVVKRVEVEQAATTIRFVQLDEFCGDPLSVDFLPLLLKTR